VKRKPRPEELRLWAVVTATVNPAVGRAPVVVPPEDEPAPVAKPVKVAKAKPLAPTVIVRPYAPEAHKTPPRPAPVTPPLDIEPGRKRRLTRERDPIDLTLDLHGLDQDRARAVLVSFLKRAQDEGVRAVLVITGKGWLGDGVLRRRTPEWLAEPGLRPVVAGVSEAHRRHGGEGALYVALKRKG
jgi:DNA-nicking Smr family endonuclease